MIRPKKKYCLFPISDRSYHNMCDPNLFYVFKKKKKKKKKKGYHKLRDELLTVIKVTPTKKIVMLCRDKTRTEVSELKKNSYLPIG